MRVNWHFGWTRVKRGVLRALKTARVLLFHGGLEIKPTRAGPKNMEKFTTAVQFRAKAFNLTRVRQFYPEGNLFFEIN